MKQVCNKCNIEKDIEDFYFRKDSESYRKSCKMCWNSNKEYKNNYRLNNKEKISNYHKNQYRNNKEKITEQTKKYYQNHKKYYQDYRKKWHGDNKEYHNKLKQKYYKNNKEKIIENILMRRKTIPEVRIANNLRRRINHALKNKQKLSTTKQLLGCSFEEFKEYLESKFIIGMNWTNYGFGNDKWNIDHIIPLSNFDLTKLEEQQKACHYTNLQPLWQLDNFSKSNKILP